MHNLATRIESQIYNLHKNFGHGKRNRSWGFRMTTSWGKVWKCFSNWHTYAFENFREMKLIGTNVTWPKDWKQSEITCCYSFKNTNRGVPTPLQELALFLLNFFKVYHFYFWQLLYPLQNCVVLCIWRKSIFSATIIFLKKFILSSLKMNLKISLLFIKG